ncbi:MAG: hypothetical protein IPJ89_03100 [Candidatus Iainarchaeum archaeon]|uniref:Uncharacterized protein n=1 Tax=Candidatus Iainarchaeum sp. TaxID=3101447 RepID=A0A7T9DIW0_9ARCH|nr:MAG: hypothetical protein IPJ89_03100 [Candidatus Diapherotrites archaeon]
MPRKVIKQLLPGHPHYWEVVMLPPTTRQLRKFQKHGHFLIDVPKGKKPTPEEVEHARTHGIKVPPVTEGVRDYALEEFFKKKLTPEQKSAVLGAIEREINRAYAEDGSKYRTRVPHVTPIDSVQSIFANAHISSIFKNTIEDPRAREIAVKIESAITRVGVAFVMHEHLRAKGIHTTLPELVTAAVRFMKERGPKGSVTVVSPEYVAGVERQILQENLEKRKKEYAARIAQNRQAREKLHQVREMMANLLIPRAERKEIFQFARQQFAQKGGIDAVTINRLIYKRARLHAMGAIQAAGLNGDRLIGEIGVDMTPDGMRRLQAFGEMLRATPPEARRERIVAMAEQARPTPNAVTSIPIHPKGPRREKERRKPVRPVKPPVKATPKKPVEKLPEGFKGLVNHVERAPHVTHEMYVRLRDLLSNESAKKPKQQNKDLMRRAMRITVLAYITTEFNMSGRLHVDHLKDKYRNTLHPLVDECVASLVHNNFLEYEHHKGHFRNVALTEYAKAQGVLEKYNTRKNQQK